VSHYAKGHLEREGSGSFIVTKENKDSHVRVVRESGLEY
jgi:hypothetical protein